MIAAPSAALHATRAVPLGRGVVDMRGSQNGSVRAAIAVPGATKGAHERVVVVRYRSGARVGRERPVRTVVPRAALRDGASLVLTDDGSLQALRARSGSRISIFADDGTHAQRVSGAIPKTVNPVAFAGGGATGVLFDEPLPGERLQSFVALRPGGEPRYTAPAALDPPYDLGPTRYAAAFGPNGDGAIVAQPNFVSGDGEPVRVRRIDRFGHLGPWIPVGGNVTGGTTKVAVAADGAIALAMIEEPGASSARQDDHLVTVALRPGEAAATPPQDWLTVRGGIEEVLDTNDDLGVSFGDGEQVVVVDGTGANPVPTPQDAPGVVTVLTGSAGALDLRASLPAFAPTSTRAVPTQDGGVTVVWTTLNLSGTNAIMGSRATATGPLSPPAALVKTRFLGRGQELSGDITPQALVPIGGAESALAYTDVSNHGNRSDSRLVRLRP